MIDQVNGPSDEAAVTEVSDRGTTLDTDVPNHKILTPEEMSNKDHVGTEDLAAQLAVVLEERGVTKGETARPAGDVAPAAKTAPLGTEEITRRREALRQADAHNRIEGMVRDPKSDAVFEAHIHGEIDVSEIVPRLKAQLGDRAWRTTPIRK
jgi:hypothetical protein